MTSYEDLTNAELRKKLLEHGYDLPISINRDFLVKKLLSATRDKAAGVGAREKEAAAGGTGAGRRQTLGPSTPRATPVAATEPTEDTSTKAKKRLSLNVNSPTAQTQGSSSTTKDTRRRSGSRDVESSRAVVPEAQPHTNNTERRKPASPAVSNNSRKSTTNDSTPGVSKRSLPFAKTKNTIVEEVSDSESGVELEEVPELPPRFMRQSTAAVSFTKSPTAGPSTLSRRSLYDPPKYPDDELSGFVAGKTGTGGAKEKQDRYNDYLSFFRGSGRGEELFAGNNRKPTVAKYSSRTYSEDESEEEVEHASPSRIRRLVTSLNPMNRKLNLSSIKSWSPFREKPETSAPRAAPAYSSRYAGGARLNNGHSEGRAGPKAKPKGFLRGVFERNGNGSAVRDEGTYDDSPIFPKILLAFVLLFFGILGACYYYQIRGSTLSISDHKISVPSKAYSPKTISRPAFIPVCGTEGVSPLACIQREYVKNSRVLFNQLRDELVQRANWKGCGAEVDDKLTLAAAKTLLYRLSDLNKPDVDNAFNGLLFLSVENPKWGLRIETADSTEVMSCIDASLLDVTQATISAVGISPSIVCVLWSWLLTIIANAFIFVCSTLILFGLVVGFRYHLKHKKQSEKQMFDLIEEILSLLHQHYESATESGSPTFLAVNHIRDELVAPKDRERKLLLWNKAVTYISENESRIREEIQHISGEEYKVWRWIPSASSLASKRKSLSPSPQPSPAHLPNLDSPNTTGNQWQGQAFEMSDGSPNAVPVTPTTCLKIRQMFDSNMNETKDQIVSKVEKAIREKCGGSNIVHVGIETSSPEGCVYVKCATKEDARCAYMSLHGWWFDGHLLSVKFLREERYNLRFPGAKKL